MTIEKKGVREREKMVTLLLSGSGVDVTSMQDCFIQAGRGGSLVFNYEKRL